MDFVGIGFWEIVFVLVIGLLVVGPRRLPEVASMLGAAMRRLTSATSEISRSITAEVEREKLGITDVFDGPDEPAAEEQSEADSDAEAK